MKKFKIHMVEKHYDTFEVEAEDIETAKDILMSEVGADTWSLNVVTEFYDDEWNEI